MIALLFLWPLISPPDAPPPPPVAMSAETAIILHAVAARCAGEARVVGVEGVHWCASTVFNRLRAPGYPNDWQDVLTAYYAPDLPPTEAELRAVWNAWLQPKPGLFCYSKQDVARLGLEPDQAITVIERGSYALYIYD